LNVFSLQSSSTIAFPNQESIIFEHFELNANIYETFAEVNVTGSFSNPSDVLALGEFFIELPQGAYVDNISLVQNKTTYWGRVMKIQEAQEAFFNATESNRSATLLTQTGKYKFKVEYSVEANGEIQISLFYFKRLIRFKGHYDLSIDLDSIITQNPQSLDASISILSPIRTIQNINAPAGSTIVYHSDHNASIRIPDSSLVTEDIELQYELFGSSFGNNILTYNNGSREFFVSTFSPSLEELGIEGLAKDFVFLIDVSGSMGGQKIEQAKSALLYIIDQLHLEDNFGIVSFSSQMTLPKQNLVSKSSTEDVNDMKTWVSSLSSGGSTDINGALLTGLDFFGISERPLLLVLLTDGKPTKGVTDPTQIEDNFAAANTAKASLFTLGFGNDVNFGLLGRLARQNSGEAFKIEENIDATEQITNFYDSVSTPIFKDVELLINNGVLNNEVFPYFIPNLFDGSEIFLVGEREAGQNIDFVITGVTSVGELSYNFELNIPSSNNIKDSWIELMWAIAKIDDLLRSIEYGEGNTELIDLVITMALEYGIVTPYTAIFIDTLEISENENPPYDMTATHTTVYAASPGDPNALAQAGGSTSIDFLSILFAILVLLVYPTRKISRR
jgi:Ca-activated chloride channel family protein